MESDQSENSYPRGTAILRFALVGFNFQLGLLARSDPINMGLRNQQFQSCLIGTTESR